jgi:hypothetical protein
MFALLIAILLAGAISIKPQTASSTPAFSSAGQTASGILATSTRILLGVPVPGAASDKLFALTLPERVIQEEQVPTGWRLTVLDSERQGLAIKSGQGTDAALFLTGPAGWNVPLRTRGGLPYQEPVLLGLFDPTHAAVAARSDEPSLLSVSRVGDIRQVFSIPEDTRPLKMQNGLAWFVTAQSGEGIESPLQGPSSLIRISAEGLSSMAATSSQVIVSVVTGPADALAYVLDSGDTAVRSQGMSWVGQGQPLLWLDDRTLVLAKGTSIFVLDLTQRSLSLLATLPAAPAIGVIAPKDAGL